MARKYTPSVERIANKLKALIKAKIKEKGLIDTGALYDSIFVYPDGKNGYIIQAEDYFKYLDQPYSILDEVIEGREFNDYIENVVLDDVSIVIEDND